LRWTFAVLLVSPYFVDVVWQKLRQFVSISKVIIQNIVVSFPEVVRDNVVSDDVTITLSLHNIRNKFSISLVK